MLTYSLAHSLVLTYLFAHSLTHSLTQSLQNHNIFYEMEPSAYGCLEGDASAGDDVGTEAIDSLFQVRTLLSLTYLSLIYWPTHSLHAY